MQKFDKDFYRLKAAAADLVARCGGGKRSAEITGLSPAMISNVCQRDHSAMLSLSAKLLLELDCGAPLLSAVEADILGHRLERTAPRPPSDEPQSAFAAHAGVMIEAADFARDFALAVADGKYSRADALIVGRAICDVRAKLEAFDRFNAAVLAGGAA